jgi:putative cell wall-binding protein
MRANKIVIVRGDLEADSIAASTFANLIGAKMLLVKPDEVPYPTLDVLDKYRPNTVYIIGGEEAVSPEVASTIGKYAYKVERISGDTRYETSLEIARRIMEMSGPRVVVVTDGKEPVTYAASLAVKLNAPLVFMDENSPEEVFKFIGENDFKVVAKLYNE